MSIRIILADDHAYLREGLKSLINKDSSLKIVSEACNGDFIFDLAVVASSWCFDDNKPNYEKINTLLSSYGLQIQLDTFKEYIKKLKMIAAGGRDFNETLRPILWAVNSFGAENIPGHRSARCSKRRAQAELLR